MAKDIAKQFQKLRDTILQAKKLNWNGGDEYIVPVSPIAIGTMTLLKRNKSFNFLIVSERVPIKYIPFDDDSGFPLGFVSTELEDNFELIGWDSASKTLNKGRVRMY